MNDRALNDVLAALRWFISIDPVDNVRRAGVTPGHAELFRVSGPGPATVEDGEIVAGPSKIDELVELLLAAGKEGLANDIERRWRELCEGLTQWRHETHEAAERWRWDTGALGDPTEADQVLDRSGIDALEGLRDDARRLVRRLEMVRDQLRAADCEGDADPWVPVRLDDLTLDRKWVKRHADDPAKPWIRRLGRGKYEIRQSKLRDYLRRPLWEKFGA